MSPTVTRKLSVCRFVHFITLVLIILPINFLLALIFAMILMLVFIGKYPLKYIRLLSVLNFISCFFLFLCLFPILAFLAGNNLGKRIENFSTDKPDEDDYQIEKAKMLCIW
jgi:cell division protein FtsW